MFHRFGRRKTPALHALRVVLVSVLGCACCLPGCSNSDRSDSTGHHSEAIEPRRDASDDLFESEIIPRLRIQLTDAQAQKLRDDGRRYTHARIMEREGDGERAYPMVAVKLKGAAGSYRDLDDRPAFTLRIRKPSESALFHDLEKWHLNNSVQDESYLCELVCSRICAEAKLPTPRVTHAHVWLNERDLGIYVLKEAFDARFLARHFSRADGNLYDGGFMQDIDADLELDEGDPTTDRADLRALLEACREPDPTSRAERVAERLDVEQFLTFMAIEFMTCHWDGYACNRNNYRIYFDPATGLAHFLPHGMDQLFGDSMFPLFAQQEPFVAAAVWLEPAWRRRYRDRVSELQPLFAPEILHPLIDQAAERLRPVLEELGADAVTRHHEHVESLKQRIAERAQGIAEQLSQPEPEPLNLVLNQPQVVADWHPVSETEAAHLEQILVGDDSHWTITVIGTEPCVASWRSRVLLSRGVYELRTMARGHGIEADEDERGRGAGIRISGNAREESLEPDQASHEMVYRFEVAEPVRSVELVAELRATRGRVWFEGPITLTKVDLP